MFSIAAVCAAGFLVFFVIEAIKCAQAYANPALRTSTALVSYIKAPGIVLCPSVSTSVIGTVTVEGVKNKPGQPTTYTTLTMTRPDRVYFTSLDAYYTGCVQLNPGVKVGPNEDIDYIRISFPYAGTDIYNVMLAGTFTQTYSGGEAMVTSLDFAEAYGVNLVRFSLTRHTDISGYDTDNYETITTAAPYAPSVTVTNNIPQVATLIHFVPASFKITKDTEYISFEVGALLGVLGGFASSIAGLLNALMGPGEYESDGVVQKKIWPKLYSESEIKNAKAEEATDNSAAAAPASAPAPAPSV